MAIQASSTNYSMDKFRTPGPGSESITNEERIKLIQSNFVLLALPNLTNELAVSTLQACDPHLDTLVFTSFGYGGNKFSMLVLGEYARLCNIPGFKLGDSTKANFGKDREARLLAIDAVFQKYLNGYRVTPPGSPELKAPHDDYDIVKSNFRLQLSLDPSTESLLERAAPSPKLSRDIPGSIAYEAEELRRAITSDSPEASEARRAFVLKGFTSSASLTPEKTSTSPESLTPEKTSTSPADLIPEKTSTSPADLIPAEVSPLFPVETRAAVATSPTGKPTVDVPTQRGHRRSQLAVRPAAEKAPNRPLKRIVRVSSEGIITCSINK